MRKIDEQFLETPVFGVRQMTWHLRNEGHLVNEKRIRRLMRLMGLMPIYQKPNTSKAAKGTQDLSVSAESGLRVDPPQPGLGRRHHLSADAQGVPASGGDHGLAHPQGAGLADLEHRAIESAIGPSDNGEGRRTSASRR